MADEEGKETLPGPSEPSEPEKAAGPPEPIDKSTRLSELLAQRKRDLHDTTAPKGVGEIPGKTTTGADEPSYISEENKRKANNLTQAKDRAQLTATSAMSVVHIALLKDLLVLGPNRVQYFTASLALIITCLILQVIAGIISLYSSHMRSYFAEHKGDMCEDFLSNVFCCKLRYHKDKKSGSRRYSMTPSEDEDADDVPTPTSPGRHDDETGCCPVYCTGRMYTERELDVLDRYQKWWDGQLKVDIRGAKAEVEVGHLNNIIAETKEKLASQEMENEPKDQELEEMLKEAEQRKKKCEDDMWHQVMYWTEGMQLWQHNKEIRENHMLKRATFWQHALNYIFYTVFVLNAFITGLGIAEIGGISV